VLCSATCAAYINKLHFDYGEAVAGALRCFGDRACACATLQRLAPSRLQSRVLNSKIWRILKTLLCTAAYARDIRLSSHSDKADPDASSQLH